jgi:hypothetical protein
MFTARYALGPYIKQIRFVYKGLMQVVWNVASNNFVTAGRGELKQNEVLLVS